MTLRLAHSVRPGRAALGVRWLVLVVILFGTCISSIGSTNSHGIAGIQATLHAAPLFSDTSDTPAHGHAHEDGDSKRSDHPHHGADHSHDNAHALSAAWGSAAPMLPEWFWFVRPSIEMVRPYRLERPPMA